MWYDGLFNIYLSGGKTGKANRKKIARMENNFVYQNKFSLAVNDSLNRYKFNGLTKTMSERTMKQSLLWYGGVCVFEMGGNLLTLPATPTGDGFNIYGDPGKVWVFSRNGALNKEIPVYLPGSDVATFLKKGMGGAIQDEEPRGVFIRENETIYPFINHVNEYALSIADTTRTLDIYRKHMKRPYVIATDEDSYNTVSQFFKDTENNEDVVFSSGYDASKVNVLPLIADTEALNRCTALIEWYENRFKMLCGIGNTAQMDKKGENLLVDEIKANDDYTAFSIERTLNCIQSGLDQVNMLYGTNITVEQVKGDEDYVEGEAENVP